MNMGKEVQRKYSTAISKGAGMIDEREDPLAATKHDCDDSKRLCAGEPYSSRVVRWRQQGDS